jgi:hypothetical protein
MENIGYGSVCLVFMITSHREAETQVLYAYRFIYIAEELDMSILIG